MFLPWSLITRQSKKQDGQGASSRKVKKQNKALRRRAMKVEALEDRVVPATMNFFVDALYDGANGTPNGDLDRPFTNIQDALKSAEANPGPDKVYVYGNNSSDPAKAAYVWTRDGDANLDGILDGNMMVGTDPTNTVEMYFRANLRNPGSPGGDGGGGAAARLVVKMLNNIVDVNDGSQLRIEGSNDAARVFFTSIYDDTIGGDTGGDGDINAPQRANWGGIRYRAEATDQGPTLATGSLVNFADIRYTGQTVFDEVVGFASEFASIRMEANATTASNVRSAQVRVWNTIFQHGGRALDINLNALGDGGKATSVTTGPDLGAATAQGLRFIDNSINGAFIFVPSDFFTGFLQQLVVNAVLDDVGVPYVITNRLVLGHPQTTPGAPAGGAVMTFNEGIIFKAQNSGLDGIDFGQPNDRTFGTIRVNGSVNRPVLFTSLTDDAIPANTDLSVLYNNGSLDTNNDSNTTVPQPGDWGGIRIAQGNIDHAVVKFGGGVVQVSGTFVNWPAIRVFARDLTPYGQNIQQVRVSNTEVTRTFTDDAQGIDSPAIDLFSRDDGDTRYFVVSPVPPIPLRRTGDVQVMDNFIHDNEGKAIAAHPLYYHDARNSTGGYGVYFRRNIIEENTTNGVFTKFILDQARAIDRNLPSAGAIWDDSDIVQVFEGQALIVHPDQYFQMMSRRGVLPDAASGGYLQRIAGVNTATAPTAAQDAFNNFINNLVLRLPGNLPTNTTLPMNLPLQRGPFGVNSGLVDSGLFYYQTFFDLTSRNVANGNGTRQRGEEWRDWGVDFVYTGAGAVTDPLRPFVTVADPSNPGGLMLKTDANDGTGSFDIVFPNAVSAVGFYIVNNQNRSPGERIELVGVDGKTIEVADLPQTLAGGRAFFSRISKTPIHKVRIFEDAGDSPASVSTFGGPTSVPISDLGTNSEASVTVGPNFTITDVNVNVSITHARASDLVLELVAPNGTTVVPLATRTGGAGTAGANYTNTTFDDGSTTPISAGLAPFSGSFAPVSFDAFSATPTGLGVLNGMQSAGTWKLRVRDLQTGSVGTITNFSITFKGVGLQVDNPGITGLTWVDAPESLVVKANTEYSTITAGGVRANYAGTTQDINGVIVNGFTPQMIAGAVGANAPGATTFGQSTNSSFTYAGPPVILQDGGLNIIPLNITADMIPYDMTVRVNLTYGGSNNTVRMRLRAPDGTEIDLVTPNTGVLGNGMTNTTFDDSSQYSNNNGTWLASLNNTSVQSSSFSSTRGTAAQSSPFGLSFYRKNVRGTWSLVIEKATGVAGTLQNYTITFRNPVQGWGSTIRILGQGTNPVVLSGIQDDTVGAGPVGHVQFDNGSDGPTTANPGQWRGLQILPGVNSSTSDVVTQNPNGTLNRRYSDLNPYTRWDEGLTYPGLTNATGVPLSIRDELSTGLPGLNGIAGNIAFDQKNFANYQDGTLVEYADIRFANIGVDIRTYPKNKLTIDANEWEPSSNPVESNPNNSLIQPTPTMVTNEFGELRFGTMDGTYKVAGRAGGMGDGTVTQDVDWYLIDNPGQDMFMYLDLESGLRSAGNDEPAGRDFVLAGYDAQFHLLYWTGQTGGLFGPAANPNAANAGNSLGPVPVLPGDQLYVGPNFPVDVRYVAVMPVGRIPRSFIPPEADPDGLGNVQWSYFFNQLPASPAGSDGGFVDIRDAQGNPVNPANDWAFVPVGFSGVGVQGGYELTMRLREPPPVGPGLTSPAHEERQKDPLRQSDGQILVRSNTVAFSLGDGIALRDSRMPTTNQTLGANMPLQAARFPFNAVNRATSSVGNPFRNEDVNNLNPQFSAPANFVPGPQIQNNLIARNGGDGISLREDRTTNATIAGPTGLNVANPVPYSSNIVTPTAFTEIFNNTIDANTGHGIRLFTRGGPTVNNNIVSNNVASGMTIVDGYDILTNTPAVVPTVSFNIFFNNFINGAFSGSNNLVGNASTVDPQYIDPTAFDYRVRITSPAVDSAVSDLQDRLRSVRFPQVPTRAPNLDLRGKARVDNPARPNVGSGAFPFYDRGALETSELSLRVIGLSVLADNNILGSPITAITIDFAGRVDTSTFNAQSVQLRQGSPTGPSIPINFPISPNVYDTHTNVHTFTLHLFNPLPDGTYFLVINGTATAVSVKDIAGQLLDGEFPAPYRLPSGDGAPGGTFIYPFTIRTGKISGTVWQNNDADNVIDPGEPGIQGATVNLVGVGDDNVLFTGDDEVIDSQITGLNGSYLFSGVGSGQYYVDVDEATLPSPNLRLNTPPDKKVVNLPIGGIKANLNFGYWIDNVSAQVNGRVFNDINGNGQIDPGEPALTDPSNPNASLPLTLTLTSGGADFDLATAGDNVVFTVLTDSNGNYSFGNLPGNNYRLDLDEAPIPPTFVRTLPQTVPVTFFLFPDTSRVQNYGFQEKQATINGLVFNDADGDGQLDGGETGIGSVAVQLQGAGNDGQFGTADDLPTLNTTTAGDGSYNFFPLTAGVYRVKVDSSSPVLANYFLTTGNATQTLTLPNGNTTLSAAPVGYQQDPFTGQILGLVFNDQDADGQFDPGEPGFNNINVELRWAGRDSVLGNSDDQIFVATTDSSGSFNRTGLPVGDFYVQPINPPAGFSRTTPATVPVKITLGIGGINANSAFFGYQAANASISGVVFSDTNGNGSVDPGETGRFAGVRVFIDSNNNNVYNTGETFVVSAAGTGAYSFSGLAAGTYRVMLDTATLPPSVPAGFVASTGVRTINLPAGGNVFGQDFGLQQRNALVTGRVFIDSNSNGVFDAGSEVGSPNQTVTLTFTGSPTPGNFTNPQTFVTGSDGTFTFAGLPAGSYTLSTTVPNGGTVPANPGNPQSFVLPAGGSASRLFPVQFSQSATAGVWYLSFAATPSTTLFNSDGSTTLVTDRDIVRLTAPQDGEWRYDVFFQGGQFGLAGGSEAIDAFTFTKAGEVIVSTRGTFNVQNQYSGGFGFGPSISGFGEDLLKFTPSSPSQGGGLTEGTWSLFFKGSRVGLSGASENVDAVSLFYNTSGTLSRILLSTAGTALVSGGISASPQDILAFAPTNLGATTSGTFSKMFSGSSKGLNDPSQENIDALFYQTNPASAARPFLYISTAGSFSVPGPITGNSGDILKFNATSGGPVGALAGSFSSIALSGSQFGHAGANVTGFYLGTIPTDPNPFGGIGGFGGSGFGGTSSLMSSLMVAPAGISVDAPATTTTKSTPKTTTAAKVAASTGSTAKVGSQQADKFFTSSKRTRSSVSGLVTSLLHNLTSLNS